MKKVKSEEDVLPDWIVKVKNEIENMSYEEYVKDVDKFFNELKKNGIEKVLFKDIKWKKYIITMKFRIPYPVDKKIQNFSWRTL